MLPSNFSFTPFLVAAMVVGWALVEAVLWLWRLLKPWLHALTA